MRSKVRKASSKPAVAYRLEEAAKLNIACKRDLLVSVTQRASLFRIQTPENIAEWDEFVATVPTSRTQFNNWTSEAVPRKYLANALSFGSNGNDTLKKSGLLKSVEDALSSFKETLKKPDREQTRGKTIAALERQVNLSNTIRLIAEGELRRLKNELARINDVCEDLRIRLASAEREGRLASQRSAAAAGSASTPGKVVQLRSKRTVPPGVGKQ